MQLSTFLSYYAPVYNNRVPAPAFITRLPKFLFIFAAIWSVVAGLIIFFTFGGTMISEIPVGGDPSQQVIQHLTWYQARGEQGITILLFFTSLYCVTLLFYLLQRLGLAVAFGLFTIIYSGLWLFSIGTVYWPGSLAVLIGLILLPFTNRK